MCHQADDNADAIDEEFGGDEQCAAGQRNFRCGTDTGLIQVAVSGGYVGGVSKTTVYETYVSPVPLMALRAQLSVSQPVL